MAGNADYLTIDNCEFSERKRWTDDGDGCGFDFEWGCDYTIIKNSFFYNNASGAIFFCNSPVADPPYNTHYDINNNLIYDNCINEPAIHENCGQIDFHFSGASDGSVTNNIFYSNLGKPSWSGAIANTIFSGNSNGSKAMTESPVISLASGTYSSEQTVNISCNTPGAEIRYTIDGSIPTSSSNLYFGPITVSYTQCLNAKAFKDGYENSQAKSRVYVITNGAMGPTPTPGSTQTPGSTPSPTPTPTSSSTPTPTSAPGSNIALGKSATDSSNHSSGETAAYAVDGSLSTHWCTTNACPQWMTVDLGKACNVTRWVVKHAEAGGEPAVYNTKDCG